MIWDRRSKVIAGMSTLVAAAATAGGLIVTSGSDSPPAVPAADAPAALVPVPTTLPPVSSPAPQTVQPGLYSPYTGLLVTRQRRVLVVKIDNVAAARPQTGIAAADLTYVLPVEGGLSRIMAVFASHLPKVIGPVRSARESDIVLWRQFGRPAVAYSGAAPPLVPFVHRARIADLRHGLVPGYFRSSGRLAPHNLYASTGPLLSGVRRVSPARDIGFRFGSAPPGGHKVSSWSASYPAASFRFTWSSAEHRWLVSMDGSPAMTTAGHRLGSRTVVIQRVKTVPSRFHEYGGTTPYVVSTGKGSAVLLRDGKWWDARWSRPDADGGTAFTVDGDRARFTRGPVWIVLVPS